MALAALGGSTSRSMSLSSLARNPLQQRLLPSSATGSTIQRNHVSTRAEAEAKTSDKIVAPADFTPAEPKKFTVGEGQLLDIITASLPMALRFGTGVFTTTYSAKVQDVSTIPADTYFLGPFLGRGLVETSTFPRRPEQPIVLYEFEGCPFCRKVREVVSMLDLDVLYYPCPQGSPIYRPKAIAEGGKKQFPYMIDPNTGVSMYESDDIIKYLCDTYGDGTVPLALRLGILTTLTAGLGQIGRISKGSRYIPARQPSEPLELWAYEPSPFCKIVREVLVELELPHIYHSTPRGSAKREELMKRTGRFQVPYLEDPNTGVKTFESKAIIDYLRKTYTL